MRYEYVLTQEVVIISSTCVISLVYSVIKARQAHLCAEGREDGGESDRWACTVVTFCECSLSMSLRLSLLSPSLPTTAALCTNVYHGMKHKVKSEAEL